MVGFVDGAPAPPFPSQEAAVAVGWQIPDTVLAGVGETALAQAQDSGRAVASEHYSSPSLAAPNDLAAHIGSGEGLPPDARPETGKDDREIIARCDFREYFKLAAFGEVAFGNDRKPESVYGIEDTVQGQLEEAGTPTRLLIRELRSNYWTFCALDTYVGVDSGHRLLEVSRDTEGRIHIDYFVEDEVRSETFNIYAAAFEQELELVDQPTEAKLQAKSEGAISEDDVADQEEKALLAALLEDAGQVDELMPKTPAGIALLLGNVKQGGDGGRGIPLVLELAAERSIERFGPDNRGAHLHLVIADSSAEATME